jgi:hypothetical protein
MPILLVIQLNAVHFPSLNNYLKYYFRQIIENGIHFHDDNDN